MSRRVRLQVLFQGSDSEVVVPERELVVINFVPLKFGINTGSSGVHIVKNSSQFTDLGVICCCLGLYYNTLRIPFFTEKEKI